MITKEGLAYTEQNMPILLGLVEGCPSEIHPKPILAKAGHMLYDYEKHLAKKKQTHEAHKISLKKEKYLKKNKKTKKSQEKVRIKSGAHIS